MYAEFRHLDGAYAGETRIVRKDFATIGRHPSADVLFDAKRDLDVSGRHAAVFRQGPEWVIRDLGSSNGTWVNGARLKGDRVLASEDVVRFGASGPQLVFRAGEGEPATVPVTRKAPAPAPAPVGPVIPVSAPTPAQPRPRRPPGTTTRVRREVRRQTASWKRMTVIVGVVGVLAASGFAAVAMQKSRALEAERTELLARTDSLLARMQATSAAVAGLKTALAEAKAETEGLRAGLAQPELAPPRADSLARELATSLDRHEAVVRAAELDVEAVAKGNSDAVGLLLSELPGGRWVTGTGFVVRVKGDTGWLATSRHLVVDSAGRPATRLGIIFNGSSQNFRLQLLGLADSADLAIARVRVRRGVPAVRALGAAARPSQPVAIFGFPFGFDFPVGGDWRKVGVHASRFSGTIRNLAGSRLELDGYGAAGSSGSPVFNAAGEVIGVVFGGDPASAGRTVYAVPVRALAELMDRLGLTRG